MQELFIRICFSINPYDDQVKSQAKWVSYLRPVPKVARLTGLGIYSTNFFHFTGSRKLNL
jgi:hypothetical protein